MISPGYFPKGDGVFRGVREGVFTTGGGDSCFRFATASEYVLTGAGGVFHIGEGPAEEMGGREREGV